MERKYLIFKGEEFPECSLIHEKPTTRVNGVIVSVQLKSHWREVEECEKKIKQQLAYLDNVYYNIPGFKNSYKIHRGPCFQFSDLTESGADMHISLKNIRYPIDWTKIGVTPIHLPIALRFDDYDNIKPIFNRESIQYNSASIRAIKEKIVEVAKWFADKWNSDVAEFDNFRKARKTITEKRRPVHVAGQVFDIAEFIKNLNYFQITLNPPRVKGISLRSPKFYADLNEKVLGCYEAIAVDRNGTFKKAHIKYDFNRLAIDMEPADEVPIVLLDEAMSGYFKEYLREKYPANNKYVIYIHKARDFKRSLSSGGTTDLTYESLLGLNVNSPTTWDDYIKEFELVVQHYQDTFIDERGAKSSLEYTTWLNNRRAQIKAGAKPKTGSTYIPLDKQKGEVTIYLGRDAKVGDAVVYEKDKEKIEDIQSIKDANGAVKRPTVYWSTAEDDLPDGFVRPFMEKFNFIRVNQTELKHFQSIKHFMSKQEFLEAKPLARLATAILIDNILDLEPPNANFINVADKELGKIRNRLIEYKQENLTKIAGRLTSGMREIIYNDAVERKHWDRAIYADALLYKEKLKPYAFLSLIKEDDDWRTNEEQKQALKTLTYIMLKHYKLTGHKLEEFELLPKYKASALQEETAEEIDHLQIAVA